MKENNSGYKSAINWESLDNDQRRKLIKKLEQDYGSDFGHQAKWNNEYVDPPVKVGSLLSQKRNLDKDSLGFYANEMLRTIVDIRSARGFVFHAPKVVKKVLDVDTKFSWVGVCGDDKIGTLYYSKDKAKELADKDNKLFSEAHAALGRKMFDDPQEIVMPAGSTIYELHAYDPDQEKYIVHPQWNAFKDKKGALDRASNELRFTAAFFIQWKTWKAAGLNAPESYDLMKENVFTFTKAQILNDMANECCSTCSNLCKTPYWKTLKNPEVDVEFIEWCKANL